MIALKIRLLAPLGAITIFSVMGSAFAQLVGFQFVGNGGGNVDSGATASHSYTGTGVLGESFFADTFNTTNNGASITLNSSDTVTSGGVSLGVISSSTDVYAADRSANQSTNLYADALETDTNASNTETYTFTLGNLTVGASYNVVLYGGNFPNYGDTSGLSTGSGDGNQDAISLTVNGVSGSLSATTYSPTPTAGDNYYETTATANSSGDIVIVGTSTHRYTPYNAISIQAIPEPPIGLLMIFGAGVLVMIVRRRVIA